MPLAHVYCSDALPSAYATFYDTSVPLTTNYEDTSRRFNIIGQIQGHPIRGLVGIGKEAVRKGLVEGGGVKVVGRECMPRETNPLVDLVMTALHALHPASKMAESLNATDEDDAKTMERSREVLGDFLAEKLYGDKDWALTILFVFPSGEIASASILPSFPFKLPLLVVGNGRLLKS